MSLTTLANMSAAATIAVLLATHVAPVRRITGTGA